MTNWSPTSSSISAYSVCCGPTVLRLIPCFLYYFPLQRHCDMNECLSAIRSINWIQRNVIHYCLQASRCSGFCKLNSFIMLIPLFCQMHHFHLSELETSSEWLRLRQWGHGWHSMRWERENRFEWRVACDNHNWGLWVERIAQCNVAPCWMLPPCISCRYCDDLNRIDRKQ